MNKLRMEVHRLLADTESFRPAVLRRSLLQDYLYATDLPQAADAFAVSLFRNAAEKNGWITEETNGWIQLDYPEAEPGDTGFEGPFGQESGCCADLLRRHPEHRKPGARERRMLIKAGEENPEAYEKTCAKLHREWAETLRHGDALPDLPEKYFRKGEEI